MGPTASGKTLCYNLPVLDAMMSKGLVTTEKVQVLQYGETRVNV